LERAPAARARRRAGRTGRRSCAVCRTRCTSQSRSSELRVEELNPDDEIVVYCHQGVRSAAVANYLRGLGFRDVKNLEGGLDLWSRTVDPTMRRY